MSVLGYFRSSSKLKNAIKLTAAARKADGSEANRLFQEAYQNFAAVSESHSCYAEALYNWGFALMHQAQTKSGEEANKLFEEANMKFSFCLTISPKHLGATVDGGVALMHQARANGAGIDDELYVKAKNSFLKAETIQNGFASYNLACLSALAGNDVECQKYLENARDTVLLPEIENIEKDQDLGKVKNKKWFKEFLESLIEPEEEAEVEEVVEVVPEKKPAAKPGKTAPKKNSEKAAGETTTDSAASKPDEKTEEE